jgi:hypothetical protein
MLSGDTTNRRNDPMPDISVPEVRLKDKLPEGLRDMTVEDIQKALPEFHLPKLELSTTDIARDAQRAAKDAGKAAGRARKDAAKAARGAQKDARKAARGAQKTVAREAAKVLPRRAGPNPVPIGILAMLGGLVVGWILATNATTGPKIQASLRDLQSRFETWRGRGAGDHGEARSDSGVGTDPIAGPVGDLPEGLPKDDPVRVTAGNGTTSSQGF